MGNLYLLHEMRIVLYAIIHREDDDESVLMGDNKMCNIGEHLTLNARRKRLSTSENFKRYLC